MLTRLARLGPYLLLGPLTGPLTAGLVANLAAERPGMALVYALGLVEVALGLPAILAKEVAFLVHLRA